jgi:hypothetical protein
MRPGVPALTPLGIAKARDTMGPIKLTLMPTGSQDGGRPDLRTLQELAGHSKPELTARNSHRRLDDLAGAVGKLPALVPAVRTPNEVPVPLRMTGTDAVPGVPPSVLGVPTGDTGRRFPASSGAFRVAGGRENDTAERLENQAAGADSHQSAPAGNDRRGGTRTRRRFACEFQHEREPRQPDDADSDAPDRNRPASRVRGGPALVLAAVFVPIVYLSIILDSAAV